MKNRTAIGALVVAIGVWAVIGALVVVVGVSGCTSNPNTVAVEQAQDYHESVVLAALLPHYLDPNPTPRSAAQMANVDSAVAEHGEFLAEWSDGFPDR